MRRKGRFEEKVWKEQEGLKEEYGKERKVLRKSKKRKGRL